MIVTTVVMALCAHTRRDRRSDSKKSSLHFEQVFPLQLL
jgi:hypothetical protein